MDDEIIIEELIKVLSVQGYGLTHGDAEQALAALRADSYDVVQTTP